MSEEYVKPPTPGYITAKLRLTGFIVKNLISDYGLSVQDFTRLFQDVDREITSVLIYLTPEELGSLLSEFNG